MVNQKRLDRKTSGNTGTNSAASLLFLRLREPVDKKAAEALKNLLESRKIGSNIGLLKEKLGKLEGIKGTPRKIFEELNAVKKEAGEGKELTTCLTKVTALEGDLRNFEQGLLSILEIGIKDAERADIGNKIKRLEKEKEDAARTFGKADPDMIKGFTERLERLDVLIEICDVLLKNGGEATKEFLDEVTALGYKIVADPSSMIVALPDVKKMFEDDRKREEMAMSSKHRELVEGYLKTNKRVTRELEELREKLHLMVDVSDEERAAIKKLKEGFERKDLTREVSFGNSGGKELEVKLSVIREHLVDERKELDGIEEKLKGGWENNKKNQFANRQKELKNLISSHTEREKKLERQIAENNKEYSKRIAENKRITIERIDTLVGRVVEDETVLTSSNG